MLCVVTSADEVEAGVLALDHALASFASLPAREAADLKQALPRAHSWVAIQTNGDWKVGFSKYVGHIQPNGAPLTPAIYAAQRKKISGTDSERAIKRLAGTAYRVGRSARKGHGTQHPAIHAVQAVCRRLGKLPNALAEVYVLQGQDVAPQERDKVAMILAAVAAANLSKDALLDLAGKIEAM